MNYAGKKLRIVNVMEGLAEGLSQFCGPTRVALIYAERPDDPLRICDPAHLLDGHEPRLRELYLESNTWRECDLSLEEMRFFGDIVPEKDLGLSGVISYGGRSGAIFYQIWFVDHHPDLCSTGPIERWLEHAVCLLSHDFVTEDAFYTGSSRYVLREYATYAVRDYILDALNLLIGWDMPFHVTDVLNSILGLSKMTEEGALPEGILAIADMETLDGLEFLIRLPKLERPNLGNLKHVRKLLTAVHDKELMLVSDGRDVVGIVPFVRDIPAIIADFRKNYGFVSVGKQRVCSFSDGKFYATNREPHLVELEELLLEKDLDEDTRYALFGVVMTIVRQAIRNRHGAAIVLDLNYPVIPISGQRVETPIELTNARNLKLACALSKLDGAIHIGADLKLYAFSCLLDGLAAPNEDRSRGARYNSALRFTAQHPEVIVITVSADRPVSVFQEGVDLTRKYFQEDVTANEIFRESKTLEEWLSE